MSAEVGRGAIPAPASGETENKGTVEPTAMVKPEGTAAKRVRFERRLKRKAPVAALPGNAESAGIREDAKRQEEGIY
jgi:hypothetical protein